MPSAVVFKLLAMFIVVALGWAVVRLRLLGPGGGSADAARVLSNVAFAIFIPALLFRTSARLDLATLPWTTLQAYFAPAIVLMLLGYAWQRGADRERRLGVAAPCVRAMGAGYGNLVQVGLPIAAALFGETGLAIHITIVSLHALLLLTLMTALVEIDLAGERRRQGKADAHFGHTLAVTVRSTIVHPVVTPVLAGLLFNASGWALPGVLDEMLQMLGQAAVPLCLVMIGMSLAVYGVRGAAKGAVLLSAVKLLFMPALVLAIAHWGLGLAGLPLGVVVMAAAMPVGSNALLFAQRYDTLQGEATAAIVFSTLAFAATAPLWLAILHVVS
ncbi:MAG: AEC family transporter [Burkholderiaceae bacterium]